MTGPVDALDLRPARTNSEDMASDPVDSPRRLLTLGRVDRVRAVSYTHLTLPTN